MIHENKLHLLICNYKDDVQIKTKYTKKNIQTFCPSILHKVRILYWDLHSNYEVYKNDFLNKYHHKTCLVLI